MKLIIIGARLRPRLVEEFVKNGVEVINIASEITITIPTPYTGYIWDRTEKINLSDYSGILLLSRKKRSKLLYNSLRNHILIIGNPYSRFEFDNKSFGSIRVSEGGIPVIPMVYGNVTSKELIEHLGDTLVEKPDDLSRGERVELKVNPRSYNPDRIYQKYIECGHSDERWICVEGKGVVCAMKRTSSNPSEFRANLNKGGKGEKLEVTQEMQDLAERITSIFPGYVFAGIDILTDKNTGERYFLESNVIPGEKIIEISGHNYYEDIYNSVMSKLGL